MYQDQFLSQTKIIENKQDGAGFSTVCPISSNPKKIIFLQVSVSLTMKEKCKFMGIL
jgi:hypothetical protein